VDEDGSGRIRITTGNDIPEFSVELEGSSIRIEGNLRELIIDESYLAEWEAEVREGEVQHRGEGHEGGIGHGDDHSGDHSGDHEEGGGNVTAQLERIQEVREEIAASGKDHLSDYWIEALEYTVLDPV
jgi:hypothetical protein